MGDSDSALGKGDERIARQSVPNEAAPNSLSEALLLTLLARVEKQELRAEKREAAFREIAAGVERLVAKVGDLAAKSEKHTAVLDKLVGQVTDLEAKSERHTAVLDNLVARVADLEAKSERHTAVLDNLVARVADLESKSERHTAVLDKLVGRVTALEAKSEKHTTLLDRLLAKADDSATSINQLGVNANIETTQRTAEIRSLMHYIKAQAFILLILATGMIAWWTPFLMRAWSESINPQTQTIESSSAAAASALAPPSDVEPQDEASVPESVVKND